MKRRRIKKVSNMLFISAAVLAFIIGSSLGAISEFSSNIIDTAFPVSYNVTFSDGSYSMLSDANVVFNGNSASVSAEGFDKVIPINSAVFSCTDEALRSQNSVRSALLSAMLVVFAASAAASLAWFGVEIRLLAARKPRRSAASVRNSLSVHNGGITVPHAA